LYIAAVNLPEAAVLGLTQGLTEFIPVSSTAHLYIVNKVFGWPDAGAEFTAVLQLGTLVAVIGYFLRELLGMLRAAITPELRSSAEARRLVYVIIGTIPLVIAGVLFKHAIEHSLRDLRIVATSLIVVGLVMGFVEKRATHRRSLDALTGKDALLVGIAQAFAVIPGVSRSGSTLSAAMGVGLRRDAAAKFSFLLSVPAVAGAAVFELPKAIRTPGLFGMPLLVGLLVAGVSGYLTIAWMLRFLRTRTTIGFVVYRVAVGIALLVAVSKGWLS
jgi:undecaprenyl-diphosphatase